MKRKTLKVRREQKQRQLRDIFYIFFIAFIIASIGWNFQHSKKPIQSPVQVAHADVTSRSDAWVQFVAASKELAPIYNFPLKLLLAQGALESAHGTSNFAQQRNNYFGMGAFDYDPNQAYTYENAKQGIIDYMYNMKNMFPEAWENRDNPEKMLQLLENNSQGIQYATDPDYVSKVESMPEWSSN